MSRHTAFLMSVKQVELYAGFQFIFLIYIYILQTAMAESTPCLFSSFYQSTKFWCYSECTRIVSETFQFKTLCYSYLHDNIFCILSSFHCSTQEKMIAPLGTLGYLPIICIYIQVNIRGSSHVKWQTLTTTCMFQMISRSQVEEYLANIWISCPTDGNYHMDQPCYDLSVTDCMTSPLPVEFFPLRLTD